MSDDLFLLNKRISRKKYMTYVLSFIIGFALLELIGAYLTLQSEKINYELITASLLSFQITLVVFVNIMLFILSYKRFKDLNLSGFWGILAGIMFIQIPVIIALMCIKSRKIIGKEAVEEIMNPVNNRNIMFDDATITLYNSEGN